MSNHSLVAARTLADRSFRIAVAAAIILQVVGCSSTTTTPSPASLHAEVGDGDGDAIPDPADRISPDLIHGTVDVSAGNITLTIQFAPRSLDPLTSSLTVDLDTDQNPSTGIRTTDGLGAEFALDMRGFANQAIVLKAVPGASCSPADPCYIPVGVAPLTVAADRMAVTMPLTQIASTDGRLNYRARAYAFRSGATGPAITDVMPDISLSPAHVP